MAKAFRIALSKHRIVKRQKRNLTQCLCSFVDKRRIIYNQVNLVSATTINQKGLQRTHE